MRVVIVEWECGLHVTVFLDAVILLVSHIDVSIFTDSQASRIAQLVASALDAGHKLPLICVYLAAEMDWC